jgi:iron-sulfur cluster repair protein YtfE (RIC family)
MAVLLSIAAPGSGRDTVGFEAPLAMLKACHRRVEQQCATLQRLVPHLARHGNDAAAAEAAQAVLRYFTQAAPRHHADEEDDLFPVLFEVVAGSEAVALRGFVDRLEADHRSLDAQWRALRPVLQNIAQGRSLDDPDRRLPSLAASIDRFAADYAAHIAVEEGELIPMAERWLDAPALARLGEAMRARRAD